MCKKTYGISLSFVIIYILTTNETLGKVDVMERDYGKTIVPAVESLLSKKSGKRFLVVKHYNTFAITEEVISKLKEQHTNLHICYKHFNGSEMIEAFEPFLCYIREIYGSYEKKTPEEFVRKFEVYKPHQSVLETMLTEKIYRRREDILLDEIPYEKEQILCSVEMMLTALAKHHPVLFVLDNLNMAALSTILLLQRLLEENRENIYVYGAFNELYSQPEFRAGSWEAFVEKLEDDNCIVDGGAAEEQSIGRENERSSFHFKSSSILEYIVKLYNMYTLLEFEQAQYYLSIIYRKIEVEKLAIDEDSVFAIFLLYAKISIYLDVPNALLLCDKLQALQQKDTSPEKKFQYNYVLGQTQMYNGNLNAAKECADRCALLAEEKNAEEQIFKAELLQIMVHMSGWHNIFFCKSDTYIPEEFVEKCEKFGFENHLAYIYIFAFDNNVKLLGEGRPVGENLYYFQKGIRLAEKLGNKNLLLTAYRKNIMLSSSHGLFEVTDFYYHKSMEIAGDKDPERLADIYNGLGYTCCATEQYEKANKYYNKAICIYFRLNRMNYVGETLYNMAINCMLAGADETAHQYLQTCIKIINALHLNDLRVCNISKIFGLLALCSYRLEMGYNTIIYLDNTLQFLGHTLNRTAQDEIQNRSLDLSYTACDDDIFLYYYVSALVEKEKGNLQKALDFMETARVYVERSIGNQFFSKVQYTITMAQLLQKAGREEEAVKELKEGLSYAKRCGVKEKQSMLEAMLAGEKFSRPYREVGELSGLTLQEIQAATRQSGTVKNYEALKKKMEFISIWQKIIDIGTKGFQELVANALNTFMLNFSIDVMIYIRYKEGKAQICYDTGKTPLGEREVEEITEYFSQHRSGFVTSKLRKNHMEYNKVISLFGTEQVCSMVCLPFYINEELDSIFIIYILMKDNWNAPISKFMLDESDMEFFNLVLQQLQNSVEKLENEEQIRRINHRLEKSAITDYLTGLYNRDGFYKKIREWVEGHVTQAMTFLYIDLDNFKFYNDTFGHAVGDRLLKEVAEILKSAGEGGFATRFGGDEFLISLPFEEKERALALGKAVLAAIEDTEGFTGIIEELTGEKPVIPSNKKLSCSIGIAAVSGITGEDMVSEALQKADSVLYAIKHTTKGDVKYSEN